MSATHQIRIYSHWDQENKQWKSNFEKENFWPAKLQQGCATRNFLKELLDVFNLNKENYSIDLKDYSDSVTDPGYYLVFYGDVNAMTEHHGLAFITKEIVEKCNNGTIKLLIAFVNETFDSNVSSKIWFYDFIEKISQIGITKPNSVIVLTSTKFQIDILDFDYRCEFIYYPWFEASLQTDFKLNNKTAPEIDFEKKRKHFINLNFVIRPHRFLMVMYLLFRQVDQFGHISWKNPQLRDWKNILNNYQYDHYDFSWLRQVDNACAEFGNSSFSSFLNTVKILESRDLDQIEYTELNKKNTTMWPPRLTWRGAENFYCESWADLVSETHIELYGDVFLTEKTFKPMAYGLPFILNASRGSLSHLRQLGYHTFPEIFDESYDAMPGGMKKIATIGEEIVAFCTDSKRITRMVTNPEIRNKLKYNQDLFWNKNHAQHLGDLLYHAMIKNGS